MNIEKREVTQLVLTNLKALDPVKVFVENIAPGQGQITITCYGQSWTAYWGGMGVESLEEFFTSSNVSYLVNKLSDENPTIVDLDALRDEADAKGIEHYRDDLNNDYEFLTQMYRPDMSEWHDSMPKTQNHKYEYICRIVFAVQSALSEMAVAA